MPQILSEPEVFSSRGARQYDLKECPMGIILYRNTPSEFFFDNCPNHIEADTGSLFGFGTKVWLEDFCLNFVRNTPGVVLNNDANLLAIV